MIRLHHEAEVHPEHRHMSNRQSRRWVFKDCTMEPETTHGLHGFLQKSDE
jgi:hypothetical protein